MTTEHEPDGNPTLPQPDVPKRVHVLGAVLGVATFLVLLSPLHLLGLNSSVSFLLALVLGTAAGHLAARYAWRSTR